MYSHQPDNYVYPFCDWLSGNETEYKQNSDIVFQNDKVTALSRQNGGPITLAM